MSFLSLRDLIVNRCEKKSAESVEDCRSSNSVSICERESRGGGMLPLYLMGVALSSKVPWCFTEDKVPASRGFDSNWDKGYSG